MYHICCQRLEAENCSTRALKRTLETRIIDAAKRERGPIALQGMFPLFILSG